jgi:hypothetical protein
MALIRMVIYIDNNDFLFVYLNEIFILTETIVRDCDIIFNSLTIPEDGYSMIIDHENQHLINSIIVSAGNIKKLILPNPSKYSNEAKALHKTRVDRGNYLSNLLKISGEEDMLNIKVRNSIEHFDEKVDSLALKKHKNNENLINNGFILYNMSLSSRKAFQPEPYYLKAYIVDERTAFIDNKPINLDSIHKEATELRNLVSSLLNQDSPGGFIMKLV